MRRVRWQEVVGSRGSDGGGGDAAMAANSKLSTHLSPEAQSYRNISPLSGLFLRLPPLLREPAPRTAASLCLPLRLPRFRSVAGATSPPHQTLLPPITINLPPLRMIRLPL